MTGEKSKCFRTDNGGEYCGTEISNVFKSKGIQYNINFLLNIPQSKMGNRSIMEKALKQIIFGHKPCIP